mmetsp:Transcript_18786/g.52336  ORF Transcript_18786/g.52336 Transcript_18786/m.52336 type:complete len:273 (-) Transcript_18786:1371-2189(-)
MEGMLLSSLVSCCLAWAPLPPAPQSLVLPPSPSPSSSLPLLLPLSLSGSTSREFFAPACLVGFLLLSSSNHENSPRALSTAMASISRIGQAVYRTFRTSSGGARKSPCSAAARRLPPHSMAVSSSPGWSVSTSGRGCAGELWKRRAWESTSCDSHRASSSGCLRYISSAMSCSCTAHLCIGPPPAMKTTRATRVRCHGHTEHGAEGPRWYEHHFLCSPACSHVSFSLPPTNAFAAAAYSSGAPRSFRTRPSSRRVERERSSSWPGWPMRTAQ